MHGAIEDIRAAREQQLSQSLRNQHRDHDVEPDGGEQGCPRHRDARHAQQQGHQRCEREHHNEIVQRHLRQSEIRVAIGEPAPDKYHRRAWCGSEQNQAGDIAVELLGRQQWREPVANEQPRQERHREWFYQPVHHECDADTAHMLANLAERAEVDADQHRDNHDPDEYTDRQIYLRDFKRSDRLEKRGQGLAEQNTGDDAQRHPRGQVAFEKTHRRGQGDRRNRLGDLIHCVWMRLSSFVNADRSSLSTGILANNSMCRRIA